MVGCTDDDDDNDDDEDDVDDDFGAVFSSFGRVGVGASNLLQQI